MQITFDTSNPNDMAVLDRLFDLFAASAVPSAAVAQPEVAENAGSAASVPASDSFAEGSAVSEPGAEQSAPAASVPEKPKRARKPKAEPVVVVEEVVEAADEQQELDLEAPADEPPKAITIDEVRAALQQFTAAKGVPAGVALLKEFGAGRISELLQAQYPIFVARCSE